jgi:hypothetical protein
MNNLDPVNRNATPNREMVYEGDRVSIYRISDKLYFRKADLLGRGQCNGVYIMDGGTVAAVDVPTPEAAIEMENEIKELFGLPLRYEAVDK